MKTKKNKGQWKNKRAEEKERAVKEEERPTEEEERKKRPKPSFFLRQGHQYAFGIHM